MSSLLFFSAQNLMSGAMQLRYIKLMCQFEPANVCAYLSTHDGYPLGVTLDIVGSQYGIVDAHAFLLERTGDKTGALNLVLTTLTKHTTSLQVTVARRDRTSFGVLCPTCVTL